MLGDLAKNSAERNEPGILHTSPCCLDSQRRLRDRTRARDRAGSSELRTMLPDERGEARGILQQTRSTQNPSDARGGVHGGEYLRAQSDPVEGKAPAEGWLGEPSQTSQAMRRPTVRVTWHGAYRGSLRSPGMSPQSQPVDWW